MANTTCPSQEELFAYAVGRLTDEISEAITAHLNSCADCETTLAALDDSNDTLVLRLREPAADNPYSEESECREAVVQARAVLDRSSSEDPFSRLTCGRALGEYLLIEELGQGGMGRIFKALHTKLDRIVAVKVLTGRRREDRHAIARFEREMKAVGGLVHPNIVQAHDAREIDGTQLLIMEFVDGLDLAKTVERVGSLPVAEACELIRQTALALQCAHEHGLIHRDIKPSNIMLSRTGEVKLLDLGLARFQTEASAGDAMTEEGQVMGTVDYIAPEQASGSSSVDIRADLYSLGCSLYYLLTGQAPFGGPEHRGTLGKMNAHIHQAVPPIRQSAPETPDMLVAILDRMLAKTPDDRFATPAAVAAVLKQFCAGANLVDLADRASVMRRGSLLTAIRIDESDSIPLSLQEGARVRVEQVQDTRREDARPARRRTTVRKTVLIGLAGVGVLAASIVATMSIVRKGDDQAQQFTVSVDSSTVAGQRNVATNIAAKPESDKASGAAPVAAAMKSGSGQLRVALLPFDGDGRNSGALIAEILAARLSVAGSLTMVDRIDIDKVLKEQGLGASGAIAPEQVARIGHLLGAQLLVTGRTTAEADNMLVFCKAISTETGQLKGCLLTLPKDIDLPTLIDKMAAKLEESLPVWSKEMLPPAEQPIDHAAALKERAKGKAVPKIAVWIPETHFGRVVVDPAVETEFQMLLSEAGMTPIELRPKSTPSQTSPLPPAIAAAMAQLVHPPEGQPTAEVRDAVSPKRLQKAFPGVRYLICGEAFSEDGRELHGLTVSSARAEVKIVDLRSGQIILVDRATDHAPDLSARVAGKTALQKAGRALAVRMLPKLVDRFDDKK